MNAPTPPAALDSTDDDASRAAHATLIERAALLGRVFANLADDYDRSGAAPLEQFQALREAGLLRANIARADGGYGAGLAVTRAIVGEIAYGDPSVALILAMHYSHHAMIVHDARTAARGGARDWPTALAQRLTRASLEGRALINAAQVEPALGSPSHGGLPDTVARRDGAHWRITGHKRYVTGAPLLGWISVLARTDETEPRLGHFLVPRDAPGVRIDENWDPVGMRATVSHDVLFKDVAIPLDDAVGLKPASLGVQRDPHATAWYFSLVATIYDAAARAARDWLLGFINTRTPGALGGAPLASLATVQESVGRIEMRLATSDWLLRSHADAIDADNAPATLSALVKHNVVDNAIESVQTALELAGNHGITRRNPLERHHRNVLCARIHAPSNSLLRTNAGRAALNAAVK
ncbi:Alkylation response protein AidB-like acyl-CoA dehydrogenase [Paraburkholderia tropica]|uniref:acyl-CoA dehydrogenase family protein n=1 Tax=Paraburkholderia tropica TaxID=92647 RepID=UPI001CAE300C|nr:acyl-CoA dehydrogenase family protein [Paraburkholderia tropica]CAG9209955.1 Alkylation response protein AidB-like acyl-CoA dehydrogenase [Paraburkholderia tropica]